MDVDITKRDWPTRALEYQPIRARRWLGCLAYHLYQSGTRDLYWWQIKLDLLSLRPFRARATSVSVALGVGALTAGLAGDWFGGGWAAGRAATAAAVVFAVGAAGWLRSMWPHSYPPQVRLTYRTLRRQRQEKWVLRFGYGIACGLLTMLVTADLVVSSTATIVCALAVTLLPPWHPGGGGPATPRLSLRLNHRNVLAAAVQYGLSSGLVFATAAWLTHATHPQATPATAATVYATTAALGAGGWAWISLRLTHARLALLGWLPLRLWPFLDDAHNRGVLRQAGSVYQLRHALLQDHLASDVRLEHLRVRADAGDGLAAWRLVDLLRAGSHRRSHHDPAGPA